MRHSLHDTVWTIHIVTDVGGDNTDEDEDDETNTAVDNAFLFATVAADLVR